MTVCYQQRCCVAEQAAGLKRRPLWDWSREPRPWQCWSPSAGCSHPGPTPSTGCRCPAWTPWGGGTQRGLFLESVRRSGPYCQCWWQIRWSSGLESAAREKGRWIWSGLVWLKAVKVFISSLWAVLCFHYATHFLCVVFKTQMIFGCRSATLGVPQNMLFVLLSQTTCVSKNEPREWQSILRFYCFSFVFIAVPVLNRRYKVSWACSYELFASIRLLFACTVLAEPYVLFNDNSDFQLFSIRI